jgi:hypothetical protein
MLPLPSLLLRRLPIRALIFITGENINGQAEPPPSRPLMFSQKVSDEGVHHLGVLPELTVVSCTVNAITRSDTPIVRSSRRGSSIDAGGNGGRATTGSDREVWSTITSDNEQDGPLLYFLSSVLPTACIEWQVQLGDARIASAMRCTKV